MDDHLGGGAVIVSVEPDFNRADSGEKLLFAERKKFKAVLSSRLRVKVIAFARHGHDKIRADLISPDISVEDLGIRRDQFVSKVGIGKGPRGFFGGALKFERQSVDSGPSPFHGSSLGANGAYKTEARSDIGGRVP